MKISEHVIAVWAQILKKVPRSRLILKYKAYKNTNVRKRYYDLFAMHGIARSRIEFRKNTLPFLMMAEYGEIDIALDPFPFTGGMTSLFALWMGVPIVTLSGEMPISRQTESFLKLVGLRDLVAFNENDYVAFAIKLAHDHKKLYEIRSRLRDTMSTSPLCDSKGHAVAMEHLFYEMWQRKVDGVQKNQEVLSDDK
jgi:predicted O-linked N-acetylglucosamine transferase (SPINDLY family)